MPGHWEGDLLCGSHNSQIVTLVERQTRYVMLVKVTRKDSETVVNALIQQAMKLPQELYKSLTWDRGSELADHKRFTLATDIQVFFCDPRNPWQRGSNENTNGLPRAPAIYASRLPFRPPHSHLITLSLALFEAFDTSVSFRSSSDSCRSLVVMVSSRN